MTTTAAPVRAPDAQATGYTRSWPASIWTLLLGTFTVRAFGFTFPFLPYHLTQLHLTTSLVGILLATFGAGWLAGSVLCGWLADRWGRRATLVTTMLLAAAVLPLLAFAHTTPALIATSFLAGVVYDAPRPVVTAAIADAFPDDAARAAANGWRNFAVNVGAAVAGTAGGVLAAPLGIGTLICINAAVCGTFALIAWQLVDAREPQHPSAAPGVAAALRDSRLWWLLAASLAALTCTGSLFSALPLLMEGDGLSAADYGWAQAANAGVVLALSPALNGWLSRRSSRPHAMTGLFALSSLGLAVTVGATGFVSTTLGYATAAALAVPGEIVIFVAAADILNRIAPPAAQGTYAGIWGTTLAGAVIVAPSLATWALTHGGHALVGVATFGCGLLGAALCWPLATSVRRPRPSTPKEVTS
ncbi:MFS transporter [Streptomyces sp. NPDC002817]|uniref:MFS transporter n=1 Tax=Streptomyces sp. NPDC088357 TaxID=3154655 RepID=UPI0034430A40